MSPAAWPAEPRRVVVTGMGMLTALGSDVASTWAGMVEGRSGIRTSGERFRMDHATFTGASYPGTSRL